MLTVPQTTEQVLADQIARQIITQVNTLGQKIRQLRSEGIPASPEVPAVAATATTPARPARPAVPAVTPDAINAALGSANCAILDALNTALGG